MIRAAALDHDRAKAELKALCRDANEASEHGVRAKHSRSGAISFELVEAEIGRAALQRELSTSRRRSPSLFNGDVEFGGTYK